ncbi:MAG: pectate lyase [Prevotella sp.]|nr:pectate lyase [Prevotella sp.]
MLLTGSSYAQFSSAPAFPGAEGHGRYVTGGRGGNIVHVTNLNDSGTGSLRAAVETTNKNKAKIIVFDVAGVIALNKELQIGDNTTIEGQTAPYPGITVRYYTMRPGSNVIIRFIRFRRGQERDVDDGADATWQRNKNGIIFDHCSFSWSIDEIASFYDNNNFTMQWCTIAESLTNAGHGKGAHGYGGIWGGKLASFHHNLIAHVSNRGPRFNGARYEWSGYTSNKDYNTYKWANFCQAENVDFRNCVMYNAQGTCYGGPGGGQINIVNNYFKAGPCGNGYQERVTLVTVAASGNSSGHPNVYDMTSRYYISGNTTETTTGKKTENRDWAGVDYDAGVQYKGNLVYSKDAKNYFAADVPSITINNVRWVQIKMDSPAPTGSIITHSADVAYQKVLAYAGASLHRDEVDARYMEETATGTATYTGSVTKKPGLIDVVADVNGYTEATFPTGAHPSGYDTDGDGIPNEWEIRYGLNPNSAADGKTYTLDTKKYYTNLEVYCNSLVEDIMKQGMADGDNSFEEYWPQIGGGTGIFSVEESNAPLTQPETYNIAGQRVNDSYKGIVIINGKKIAR